MYIFSQMDYDDDLPPGYAPGREVTPVTKAPIPSDTLPGILKNVSSAIVNDTLAGIRRILDEPRTPMQLGNDHQSQPVTAAAQTTTVADWILSTTTTSTEAPSTEGSPTTIPASTTTSSPETTTSFLEATTSFLESTTSFGSTTPSPDWGTVDGVAGNSEWVGGGTLTYAPNSERPETLENHVREFSEFVAAPSSAVEGLTAIICGLVLAYLLHRIIVHLYRLAYRNSTFSQITGEQ